MDTTTSLREDFLLDPAVIYFNHGSFGATPRPVFESYQYWQRQLENQPTEFFGRRARELMEQSRNALAAYLGTTGMNLAFVTNTTYGLNVAIRSLSESTVETILAEGDEVLSTNHEYGSIDRTWRYYAQKQGFKYINQPIPLPVTTSQEFIEALWKGVSPRTKVIFLSHITSPTALIFPIQEVCRRAREEGIITVVDGAHAPGQIPLRLDALGADFYAGNLHKWLCAPKGSAFLYARSDRLRLIEPLTISWGYKSDRPGLSPLVDYVEAMGTRDLSAFLAVPDAIHYYEEHHWEEVRARCHAILKKTVQEIADLSGKQPISPLTADWISQMASAPLPDSVDPAWIHEQLWECGRIEIPVINWNGHKLTRISFQAYNSEDDARALVDALSSLIKV